MKSIMPGDEKGVCWICGMICNTDTHHIFGGPDRKWSEEYGLTVNLCRYCHRKVHDGMDGLMDGLHKGGEQMFIEHYFDGNAEAGMEDFRKKFRKNYL